MLGLRRSAREGPATSPSPCLHRVQGLDNVETAVALQSVCDDIGKERGAEEKARTQLWACDAAGRAARDPVGPIPQIGGSGANLTPDFRVIGSALGE